MVSGNLTGLVDRLGADDDQVASFQIEGQAVRGRITRLGPDTIDAILKRHDYPKEAARLLGEALVLATLIGASLKVDARLTVQAEGNGPVRLMVAEFHTSGRLRGYLRIDRDAWAKLERLNRGERPHPRQVFGKGVLGIIVLQDNPSVQPYQGLVPLDGATLADCAEHYFAQSEQIPTRVQLAVGEIKTAGAEPVWRAGGALIQKVADDEARGSTADDWTTARALFETLEDVELLDPDISSGRALYRLFHEDGVRVEAPVKIADACTCSKERLTDTLSAMSDDGLREMSDDGRTLEADCQFCGRTYDIPLAEILSSTTT